MADKDESSVWAKEVIGELIEYRKGYAFKSSVYQHVGHPIVRVSNLTDRSVDMSGCNFLSPTNVAEYESVKLRGGDIVIATVGSGPQNPGSLVGRAIRVPKEAEGALLNQNTVRLRANRRVDQQFLFYCLRLPEFQAYLVSGSQGSANQASITLKQIFDFKIPLPPLAEQKAIASILGSLDEKIELNRRMNATLESAARALFKSWFVDFDPVRAKVDGRTPAGMDQQTARLFPSAFEDSELGKIPQGWKPISLPDAFDFKEGPGLRNWQYTEEGMRFLNIRCIVNGELNTERANCISLEEFHAKYEHFGLQEDDVVISTSGTLGRLAIVRNDDLPIMLNTSIIRMRGIKPFSMFYIWNYLQSDFFLDEMFALASGSVQLNFGPMHLKRMKVLCPVDQILNSFDQQIEPLIRRTLSNRKQSQTLAALRDALLPKLLSGEIRVGEAAQKIENTVNQTPQAV